MLHSWPDFLFCFIVSPAFIASLIFVVIVKILIVDMEIGYGRVLNAVESGANALTSSCKSFRIHFS
jgi:hypothetical protein